MAFINNFEYYMNTIKDFQKRRKNPFESSIEEEELMLISDSQWPMIAEDLLQRGFFLENPHFTMFSTLVWNTLWQYAAMEEKFGEEKRFEFQKRLLDALIESIDSVLENKLELLRTLRTWQGEMELYGEDIEPINYIDGSGQEVEY